MSEQEPLSRFSATAGQQQQQQQWYRWNEPLSIEPCSIQHLEDHVSLMQSEIDEYQELLNSKIAQVEHARERIEYLKSIPKASARARAWGDSDIGFARTSASAATNNTSALSFSNAPQNYQHSYNKYSSSSKSNANNTNNINDGNNSNNGQQQQHIPLPTNPKERKHCIVCKLEENWRKESNLKDLHSCNARSQRSMCQCQHTDCQLCAHGMPVQQTRRIFDIEGLKGLTCFDIVHSEVCKGLWTVRNNNNKGCVVERKKALSDKVGTSGSHDVVEVRAVSYSVNRTHPVYRLLAASYGKGKETRPRRKKNAC